MIGLIAVLVGSTSAQLYSRCVLIGLRQNVATSWRDLWGQLAAVFVIVAGLALAAVLHHGASPTLILGLTVVGTLLSFVFVVQALLNVDLPRQGGSGLRKVVVYASPVYAFNLVQFLNFRLDVFLVAAFAGARELGLYALAVGLGQLLWITSSSVATVLLPRVASSPPIEGARQAAQLTRITLLIGVAGAAALALIASPLINIVYGQAYAEAVPMLLALLPGIVAYVAVKVLTAYLVGVGRLRITVIVSLIGLIATLVLDFTLIPRLGALGAAIASSVSYSLSAIVMVRWTMKVAGLPARAFLLIQRVDLLVFGNAVRRLVQ